jgi:hypothetical protein
LVYRVKGSGKVRRLSLGRIGDVGLEPARERANALTSAARQGRDLIEEEAQAVSAQEQEIAVQKLGDRYVAEKRFQRLRTAKQTERRPRLTLAPFMDWKAADIRRRDLREQCDKIAAKGLLREAGHRLQVISPLFK